MKKRNLKSLELNKKSISNLDSTKIEGGKPSLSNYNAICDAFSVGPRCVVGTLSVNCPQD